MRCMHCSKAIMPLKAHYWKNLPLCYKCFKNKRKREAEAEFNARLQTLGIKIYEQQNEL